MPASHCASRSQASSSRQLPLSQSASSAHWRLEVQGAVAGAGDPARGGGIEASGVTPASTAPQLFAAESQPEADMGVARLQLAATRAASSQNRVRARSS